MAKKPKYVGCTVKDLPPEHAAAAAETAVGINPANRPRIGMLHEAIKAAVGDQQFADNFMAAILPPALISVLTTKYWGSKGVKLGVSFVEATDQPLRDKIVAHMNAWSEFCNASFAWSQSGGEVRISRGRGGYWSYLGTDVKHIPAGEPTMNLEGFTLRTPDSEYRRVVRHETGHTLGFPHEHMRRQIVARLDPRKTVDYFLRTQGWSEQTTRQQVLTPLEESSVMGTPDADTVSIMCYELPASITTDGKPIPGGADIDAVDRGFVAKLYPLEITPPPPPPGGVKRITIEVDGAYRILTA
jgi:hypothetical protein